MSADPDVTMLFFEFIRERHLIWERRQIALEPATWTNDPILASKKFTNMFRVLDPGTQFVLTDLIRPTLSVRDQLMRLFLYRHTNLPEPWKLFAMINGDYPTVETLDDFREYLKLYRSSGDPVFSGAYIVYPQSNVRGTDKVDSIIVLAKRLFTEGMQEDIVPDFEASSQWWKKFEVLRQNKGVADFMSHQILTDFGYTPHCGQYTENIHVVPGPGALRGIQTLDDVGTKPYQTMLWAWESLRASGDIPSLKMPSGKTRTMSLSDVQNAFCEWSKYVRAAGGIDNVLEGKLPSPKQVYQPAHPGVQSSPALPLHW